MLSLFQSIKYFSESEEDKITAASLALPLNSGSRGILGKKSNTSNLVNSFWSPHPSHLYLFIYFLLLSTSAPLLLSLSFMLFSLPLYPSRSSRSLCCSQEAGVEKGGEKEDKTELFSITGEKKKEKDEWVKGESWVAGAAD